MLLDIRAARPIRVRFSGATKLSAKAHKGVNRVLAAARVPPARCNLAEVPQNPDGRRASPQTPVLHQVPFDPDDRKQKERST
jgi:hypothetical protein